MRRPEQHIIETKSQRIFEKLVPCEWIIREMKPDYGVDYLVEIFKNNESTGNTFFVQLKGSDQIIEQNTFKKQFEVKNLNYFNSLTIPTLIVLVSVNTEQTWAIWANNLSEVFNIKSNQKTISINLDYKYLIKEDKFKEIENNLNSTKKLGLFINYDGLKEKLLSKKILEWIDRYYKDVISTQFNYLPNNIEINFNSVSNEKLKVSIITQNFKSNFNIDKIKENDSYLHKSIFDNTDINILNKKILKELAIIFAKYSIKGSLEIFDKIIDHSKINNNDKFLTFDSFLNLLISAKINNELQHFNNFVKKIIDLENYDLFFLCDLVYLIYADEKSEELQKYRIENLNYLINKTNDNLRKGICYYNIGNILITYKGSNIQKSVQYYFKSRKFDPDYENRHYWWYELAGLMFEKKHYKISESFYRKSLQLKISSAYTGVLRFEKKFSPKLIYLLIADCLFMQGKFIEAHKLFEEHYSETNLYYEYILKDMVCMHLIEMKLGNVILDKKKSLTICEKILLISKDEEIILLLKKAVKLDPLNSLAWFNLGIALKQTKEFEESLVCFIVSGVIVTGDKEAQFNALFICLHQRNLERFQVLIHYIIEKHGKMIANDFTDYIMKQNYTFDFKQQMLKAFTEFFEVHKNIKNSS